MSEKWTKEQQEYANDEIKRIIDWINSVKVNGKELSPLEKFICAYNYVTDFAYNEEDLSLGDTLDTSRDIEGIYATRKIVCYGYANLLSHICDGLGIPCLMQSILIERHANGDELVTGGDLHQNNLVVLKDEKYGIDGIFYVDACWDALEKYNAGLIGNPNPNYKKYNWCLIPYEDPQFYSDITREIKYAPDPQYTGLIGLIDYKDNCIRLKTLLGLSDDELETLEKNSSYIEVSPKISDLVNKMISLTIPITPTQFYEALKVVEQARGLSPKDAETTARQTMRYNAFMSQLFFDSEHCHGCFSKLCNQNNEFSLYESEGSKNSFIIK